MAKGIEKSKLHNFKSKIGNGTASISCEKGKCFVSSDTDIMAIEIHFNGKAIIKSQLPDNWYLRGNNKKIIIFTLQNVPIKNELLFEYVGEIKITKCIVANKNAKQIKCNIIKDQSQWVYQNWSLDVESETWDNFANINKSGKVKKTSYIIDDDLPEVDKTEIKKRRKKILNNINSSGGSGGY